MEKAREDKETALADQIAARVREDSGSLGKLTALALFLDEPYGRKEEELNEAILSFGEGDRRDIHVLTDANSGRVYLYATPHVCAAYADSLLLAEGKNPPAMIAETVRRESSLYPRPTASPLFLLPPYGLGEEELASSLEKLKGCKDFEDIKSFEASTGVIYLYSERYLTLPHARGLAEWVEVEQFENQ